MFFGRKYPYSNLHDLNLDWIISEISSLKEADAEALAAILEQGVSGDSFKWRAQENTLIVTDNYDAELYRVIWDENGLTLTRNGGTPVTYRVTNGTLTAPTINGTALRAGSANITGTVAAGEIHTTTPLAVQYGGTGADNAADACANLGAVAKAGDTMTGALSVPGLNALGSYPGIIFRQSAGATPTGYITENNSTRRMYFTIAPADGGGNEVFNLPAPSTGNTNQRNYDILTSKTPVTVAQGGTGATTQAGAMGVMGLLCDSSNKTTFQFTNLSLLTNTGKYKYGLLFGGEPSTPYIYHMLINADNSSVTFTPALSSSGSFTFTGSVSGTTLTLTGNRTVYGGVRLLWINY